MKKTIRAMGIVGQILILTIIVLGIVFYDWGSKEVEIRNFKVVSPKHQIFNWGDSETFQFEFEIRGSIGYNEIKFWIYHDSVVQNNLIGLVRWNRLKNTYYNFNSFTMKSMDLIVGYNWWDGKSFSTAPNHKFMLVMEFDSTFQTLSYTIPDQDSEANDFVETADQLSTYMVLSNASPTNEAKTHVWEEDENEYTEIDLTGFQDENKSKTVDDLGRCPENKPNAIVPISLSAFGFPKKFIHLESSANTIVTNLQEQNQVIHTLSKGDYIIRSSNGDTSNIRLY